MGTRNVGRLPGRWRRRSVGPGIGVRPTFRKTAEIGTFGVVAGVAVLAPFPLGSVDWRWLALWGLVLAGATPWLPLGDLTRAQARILAVIVGASALLGLYVAIQASGWGGLIPENKLYGEARRLLDEPVAGAPSAMPVQSLAVLGGLGLALLAFAAAYVVGAEARRARALCVTLAGAAIVNGIVGYVLFKLDPSQLLWSTFPNPRGQPSGTFANRNHAATLFASGGVVFATIVLRRLLDVVPHGAPDWREWWDDLSGRAPPRIGPPLTAAAACVALALATGSRGGLLALAVGTAAAAILLVLPRLGWRLGLPLLVAGALLGLGLLAQLDATPVGERLKSQGWSQDGRWDIYRATLLMIRDHPWFGVGLGTYEHAITRYRPDDVSPGWVWDYAHSGPLQLVAELGVPAGLFGLGILLGVIGLCATGALARRRDLDLPVMGAAVGLVGLVHGSLDFSLQIPGYALVYATILGACCAQALPTRRMAPRIAGAPADRVPAHDLVA